MEWHKGDSQSSKERLKLDKNSHILGVCFVLQFPQEKVPGEIKNCDDFCTFCFFFKIKLSQA